MPSGAGIPATNAPKAGPPASKFRLWLSAKGGKDSVSGDIGNTLFRLWQ
jgi:hypothetical protein